MTVWMILTPGGALRERVEGTKAQAESWAKNHYIVYKIKKDTKTIILKRK